MPKVKESLRSIYSHKVDSISQIRKSISPSIIVESNSIIESVDAELAAYITRSSELIENLHASRRISLYKKVKITSYTGITARQLRIIQKTMEP